MLWPHIHAWGGSVKICGVNAGSRAQVEKKGGGWFAEGLPNEPGGCVPVPQKGTHHRRLRGAGETALIPPPHLVGQLWVAEVSTQGHWCGHVDHIHRRPMAGGDEQVHVVEGTLAPHEILRATHHLVGRWSTAQGEEANLLTDLVRSTRFLPGRRTIRFYD